MTVTDKRRFPAKPFWSRCIAQFFLSCSSVFACFRLMGSGASAPHLKEFFAEKLKFQDSDPAEAMATVMLLGGPDAAEVLGKEKRWYDETGKNILMKSFDHHDKDKSKKLDKPEADQFFANLVQEEETFTAAMSEAGIRASLGGLLLAAKSAGMKDTVKDVTAQIKSLVAAAKKDAAQRRKNYKASKKEFNEAAFKLMDLNGDGSICIDEFLTFFDPATDRHDLLLVELGFMTAQEHQLKNASKLMIDQAASAQPSATIEKTEPPGPASETEPPHKGEPASETKPPHETEPASETELVHKTEPALEAELAKGAIDATQEAPSVQAAEPALEASSGS